MISDISCVFEGIGDIGAIYISGIDAAESLATLRCNNLPIPDHNITAILTVARGGFLSHEKIEIPLYLYVPADDHE